MAYKSG